LGLNSVDSQNYIQEDLKNLSKLYNLIDK
jgi:hypothetical protein